MQGKRYDFFVLNGLLELLPHVARAVFQQALQHEIAVRVVLEGFERRQCRGQSQALLVVVAHLEPSLDEAGPFLILRHVGDEAWR